MRSSFARRSSTHCAGVHRRARHSRHPPRGHLLKQKCSAPWPPGGWPAQRHTAAAACSPQPQQLLLRGTAPKTGPGRCPPSPSTSILPRPRRGARQELEAQVQADSCAGVRASELSFSLAWPCPPGRSARRQFSPSILRADSEPPRAAVALQVQLIRVRGGGPGRPRLQPGDPAAAGAGPTPPSGTSGPTLHVTVSRMGRHSIWLLAPASHMPAHYQY